jgi:hypothetical protein
MGDSSDYSYKLAVVLEDVRHGQHLRFIQWVFKTSQVCLEALRHEVSHTDFPYDVYSVPIEHLDLVVETICDENAGRQALVDHMRDAQREIKARHARYTTYYGKYKTLQGMLDHYNVDTYDALLHHIYEKRDSKT